MITILRGDHHHIGQGAIDADGRPAVDFVLVADGGVVVVGKLGGDGVVDVLGVELDVVRAPFLEVDVAGAGCVRGGWWGGTA